MKAPPLAERQKPALSATLKFRRQADTCQSCGREKHADSLERWIECDAWDHPTKVLVVLCATCSRRIIGAHPRLYERLAKFQPWPGVMPLCIGCRHREDLHCRHPDLRVNGGSGLSIRFPTPTMTCGTGGCHNVYPGPVSSCDGREFLWMS